MKVAIVVLTDQAFQLGLILQGKLQAGGEAQADLYGSSRIQDPSCSDLPGGRVGPGLRALFTQYDGLICIMAMGIVVRCLAPVIKDKREDPAVVVMDQRGEFAISLLSGHLGGGNDLARTIASLTGAQPVITTATDVEGVTALDTLAQDLHAWYPDFHKNTVEVNGLLAAGKPVGICWTDPGLEQAWEGRLNLTGLTKLSSLDGCWEGLDRVLLVSQDREVLDRVGAKRCDQVIPLVPRNLALGIGCKKGKAFKEIREDLNQFLREENIHPRAIETIASIDLKKDEKGVYDLAQWLGVPFLTYPASQLAQVDKKYPGSDFVRQVTGVGAVALSACDLASDGGVFTDRYTGKGVTFALGRRKLC